MEAKEFTKEELVRCAKRELQYRERVYPRLVEKGTMRPDEARRETAMMRAIAEHLESQVQGALFG